jgi:hypothetical protein
VVSDFRFGEMFPPFSISEKLPTIERVQYRALTEQRTMARAASNIFHGKPLHFIILRLSLPSRRCHYNFEVGVITILKEKYLDLGRPGDRQPACMSLPVRKIGFSAFLPM